MTAAEDRHPDFVITCDHGGAISVVVARYRWDEPQGVWVPDGDTCIDPKDRQVTTYYRGAVRVTPMEGESPRLVASRPGRR
jgi:hypothetical protein